VLWRVAHRLDQTSKRMRTQIGITGPQRLVLRVSDSIRVCRPETRGDPAWHPSTLTGVLHRLQTLRLLKRRADPQDRRRAVLHLTVGGHDANARTSGTVEAAVATAIESCSDRDVAAAARHSSLSPCARAWRHFQERPTGGPRSEDAMVMGTDFGPLASTIRPLLLTLVTLAAAWAGGRLLAALITPPAGVAATRPATGRRHSVTCCGPACRSGPC
jgi:DNA-binding MarR family transcriptional regulator